MELGFSDYDVLLRKGRFVGVRIRRRDIVNRTRSIRREKHQYIKEYGRYLES